MRTHLRSICNSKTSKKVIHIEYNNSMNVPCPTNSKINTLPSHRFQNAIKIKKRMFEIMTISSLTTEIKITIKIHMMLHARHTYRHLHEHSNK